MKNTEKRNFRVKMNLACGTDDLRPIMHHIYFHDGKMVSTNAHILIVANVAAMSDFDQSEVEILNGKFIHKDEFKKIMSCKEVCVKEEGIVDMRSGSVYKFAVEPGIFPNYEAVMPAGELGKISQIGVHPKLAATAFKILSLDYVYTACLNFRSANSGIVITPTGDYENAIKVLLMPAMLGN